MASPGNLGSLVPAGEDAAVRKIADLQRELRELGPSVAASFASTVAALQVQQDYQASLKTRTGFSTAIFEATDIPGDEVVRYYDSEASVTLEGPTGRALVTVTTGLSYVNPGDNWAEIGLSFNVSSPGFPKWFPDGIVAGRVFGSLGRGVGVPAVASRAINVSKGLPNTFVLSFSTESGSLTTLASGFAERPHITVQVLDPID